MPLPERAVHLYACQMLSTYKIATVTGVERQRITRLLRESGIAVKPYGAGRRLTRRTTEVERLDQLMARLYQEQRMPSPQIAELTGVSEYTVRSRLRARGVPIRTRGRHNREDRAAVSLEDLAALYLQAGLSADETGKLLGVSARSYCAPPTTRACRSASAVPRRAVDPRKSSSSQPCTPTRRSAPP